MARLVLSPIVTVLSMSAAQIVNLLSQHADKNARI